VRTGQHYLDLRKQGYTSQTTYDISMEGWLIFSAKALDYLRHAQPSRISYVKEFRFDKLSVKNLPGCLNMASRSLPRRGESPEWDAPGVKFLNSEPYKATVIADGRKSMLDIVAWGDFNSDGLEDLLVQLAYRYIQGTGRSYHNFVLTRKCPDGPLQEVYKQEIFAPSPPPPLTLGTVTIAVYARQVSISTPAIALSYWDNLPHDYQFIICDPFAKLTCYDGVPEPSPDLVRLPIKRPLVASDFKKFRFFRDEPTTIGLLFGYAGGSGGSTQQMVLLDTSSTAHTVISLSDCSEPYWIDPAKHPPDYAETKVSYLGPRAFALGYAARIERAFSFKSGEYHRDPVLERRLWKEKFSQSKLTAAELDMLRKTQARGVNWELGAKLVDYIYYGVRTGRKEDVKQLLDSIHDSYRKEAAGLLRSKP